MPGKDNGKGMDGGGDQGRICRPVRQIGRNSWLGGSIGIASKPESFVAFRLRPQGGGGVWGWSFVGFLLPTLDLDEEDAFAIPAIPAIPGIRLGLE
ncbi:hypothetical protein SAY86_007761 [Trapa natans]|uniref:Uncharacterized protein n=1 Tax=Trapa natans TaxID=22666 RepID=A0AAN7LBG8_TRANT|nr:hypothetical protein SAY86_007761 [Trapa natans]